MLIEQIKNKMSNFIELFLTCADRAEAEKIADVLIGKHLVAAVNYVRVEGKTRWDGITEGDEVGMRMMSVASNFDRIEEEVANLHSYDTFVLQAISISHLNTEAAKWLTENTR